MLIGQPELREALAKPNCGNCAAHHRALPPHALSAEETGDYLRHRFRVAGGRHFR